MYQSTVNDKHKFDIKPEDLAADIVETRPGEFHLLRGDKSYNIVVLDADYQTKTFRFRINGNVYNVNVEDEFDRLASTFGMAKGAKGQVNEIKAPMPGLVLQVMVEPGQQIKKGESVIILEAMKMENVIKAPADATVKAVRVQKGTPVEKNTVLIDLA